MSRWRSGTRPVGSSIPPSWASTGWSTLIRAQPPSSDGAPPGDGHPRVHGGRPEPAVTWTSSSDCPARSARSVPPVWRPWPTTPRADAGSDEVLDEVSCALVVSRRSAQHSRGVSETLRHQPEVWAALARGELDLTRARILASALFEVPIADPDGQPRSHVRGRVRHTVRRRTGLRPGAHGPSPRPLPPAPARRSRLRRASAPPEAGTGRTRGVAEPSRRWNSRPRRATWPARMPSGCTPRSAASPWPTATATPPTMRNTLVSPWTSGWLLPSLTWSSRQPGLAMPRARAGADVRDPHVGCRRAA